MAKVKVSEISKERKINTETASADKRLDDGSYTLIIPTYRRPKRLQRLLAYLENCGLEAPVVVLDSSPDEEAELNAKTILASKLTVDHQRYRSDIHPYLKIRDGLKKIKTPFFSNIADDGSAALNSAVRKIKQLDDALFAAAQGQFEKRLTKTKLDVDEKVKDIKRQMLARYVCAEMTKAGAC
jgi:hypothetical protein